MARIPSNLYELEQKNFIFDLFLAIFIFKKSIFNFLRPEKPVL